MRFNVSCQQEAGSVIKNGAQGPNVYPNSTLQGTNASMSMFQVSQGLFTWKEEDPSNWKTREGGKTFRLLYMQKFRPKWLPSGEGKESDCPAAAMFGFFFCP